MKIPRFADICWLKASVVFTIKSSSIPEKWYGEEVFHFQLQKFDKAARSCENVSDQHHCCSRLR